MFNIVSLSSYLHLEENAALAQKLRWMEDEIQSAQKFWELTHITLVKHTKKENFKGGSLGRCV
jgi:hypothetical protein